VGPTSTRQTQFVPKIYFALAAHQPDDEHADEGRNDAGDAQLTVRRGELGEVIACFTTMRSPG
jgi:hypothetical protein